MLSIDLKKIVSYREDFASLGKIRIPNFLPHQEAVQLAESVSTADFYRKAFVQNNQVVSILESDFWGVSENERARLMKSLHDQASRGVGFIYGKGKITKEFVDQKAYAALYDVKSLLNSSELIEAIRTLSGFHDIQFASAQATKYSRGDYLTRHNDVVQSEKRQLAYVLSLTPEWHPDWGGLLQFYNSDGSTLDSYCPLFNSLTIFDVKWVHAVTYVTPFAQKDRFSITGWFGDKTLN